MEVNRAEQGRMKKCEVEIKRERPNTLVHNACIALTVMYSQLSCSCSCCYSFKKTESQWSDFCFYCMLFSQLWVTEEFNLQTLQFKRGKVLTGCSLCAVPLLWHSVAYLIWQGTMQELSVFWFVKVLVDLYPKRHYYQSQCSASGSVRIL